VPRLQQQFENGAGNPPIFLDRLEWVGVRTKRDGSDRIAWLRKSGMEELGGVGLGEQPALEIDAGRQVMECVGGPGEAIDATMLAAAIGVDRTIESNVRRSVSGYDAFRPFNRNGGPPERNSIQASDCVQPIAVRDALLQVEARRSGIADCPAPTDRLDRHRASLAKSVEHNKNIHTRAIRETAELERQNELASL
jgi:hypothetical protein